MQIMRTPLLSAFAAVCLTGLAAAQGADDCSNAEPISGMGAFFSTLNATTDGPGDCGAFVNDVWFRWTAPATSWYEATTCETVSWWQREVIAVYDPAPCWNLDWPIACDDGACLNGSAKARWLATAGNEYLIRIGCNNSLEGFAGSFQIRGCAVGSNLDCNGNNIDDVCEVADGSAPDCNGNGIPDSCDIAAGAAMDCDGNGVPDSCDPDCNGNGIPDVCDIAAGTAIDCNGNGVPDACDIAAGAADCDGNGVPDTCDIAAGAADCNGNGILDSCDFVGVPCLDRNPAGGALFNDASVTYVHLVSNGGTLEVVSFDLFTGRINGNGPFTREAYLYGDVGGMPGQQPLATGTITVDGPPGFYRATLSSPVTVSGDFWIGAKLGWVGGVAGYVSDLSAGEPSPAFWTFPPTHPGWFGAAPKRAAWRINCSSDVGDCDGDGVPDTCQLAADSTLDLDVNGVLDACEALGTPYCSPAAANSTGRPGELTVVGEDAIALNSVTLTARHLPVHAIGVFVTSLTQAPGAGIPNSQGTLCLGGDLGRFVGPGQIQSSGFHGAIALTIDLNAHPTSSSFVSVLPGETWNYQLWHRDAVGGQATSNLTDAVAVTYQ